MGLQDAGRSRHEVRVVLLAVAVGWLAAGSASAQGLGPLVEAFWAAGSVDEIDEAVQTVLALDPEIGPLFTRVRAGSSYDSNALRGRQLLARANTDGVTFRYEAYIPENYDPTRRYPVRMYLHGGVSRPRRDEPPFWRNAEPYLRDDTIVVFPESWGEAMWWQANQIENLGGMLNDLKARYNIDENAVYLMGVSDGATGAFYHAFKAPTPWAGFLSFNGHPVVLANPSTGADGQMYVTNLRNKPFFAVNGGQDRLYPISSVLPFFQLFVDAGISLDFRPKPEAGHNMQWWPEETDTVDQFILTRKRVPLPDRLVWETESTERFNRAHWLVITELGTVEGENDFADDEFNQIQPAPSGVPIGFNTIGVLDTGGIQLIDIIQGSMAEVAGVQPGDVLVEMNGRPVANAEDLRDAVQAPRDEPGMSVSVMRDGARLSFTLVPPDTVPAPPPSEAFPLPELSGRVQLLRDDNHIDVVTRGVRRYALLLSPEQFDFTQSFRVTTNGRVSFEGMVEPSPETLLRWAARDRDRTMLFGAQLDIEVEAP